MPEDSNRADHRSPSRNKKDSVDEDEVVPVAEEVGVVEEEEAGAEEAVEEEDTTTTESIANRPWQSNPIGSRWKKSIWPRLQRI